MTEIAQVYVNQLRYADALEVAEAINQLLGRVNEPNGPGGTVGRTLPASASQVTVWADSRTNSVVVSSLPDLMAIVAYISEKLDQKPQQEGRSFVYTPKNAGESNLATILNNLLTQIQGFNQQGGN